MVRLRTLALASLAPALLGGCGSPQPIADTGLVATYDLAVSRTLVPNVDPLSVLAAAEQVVESRGWVLVGRYTSEERSRIRARFAGGSVVEEYQITASAQPGGTLIEIHLTPFGDRSRSEAVLRDVLTVLGVL